MSKLLFITLGLFLLVPATLPAQKDSLQGRFYQIGYNTGYASVDNFIFKDDDYYYEVYFNKIQVLYRIKSGKINYDFIFQPEVNRAQHKLFNPWFAGNPDVYSEQREIWKRFKYINEYIFNCGVLLKTHLNTSLELYALASLGPGYFDEGTERMAKGIGFSDNLATGLHYNFYKKWVLDVRLGYRHVSNAEIKQPNAGYDALEYNLGLAYRL